MIGSMVDRETDLDLARGGGSSFRGRVLPCTHFPKVLRWAHCPPEPLEISFPYVAQQCELCVTQLDTAAVCRTHLDKVHGLRRSTLVCSRCGISKKLRHQIECQAAVCRNVTAAAAHGVRCTLCSRRCKSDRGVSIHMRSAHTAECGPAEGQGWRTKGPGR